jgi:hypothetical protein
VPNYMHRLYFILTISIVLLTACGSDNTISYIPPDDPPETKVAICGSYKTKPPKELFYVDKRLILNCDSTFNYNCYTCLGDETCYGDWSRINDVITLKTSDKLRKLKEKKDVFGRVKLCDLNNQHIRTEANRLLWQNSGMEVDTLIRE